MFGMSRTLIAAAAASLLLGVIAVWFFPGDFAGLRGPDGKTSEQTVVHTAGLPGLGDFLSRHRAKEVQVSALTESLEFLPVVPEGLPGGFRLEKTYIVTDSRGTGCCAVYRYGEEVLALVQSAPDHPVKWAVDQLEGCTIAGLFCRRGSDRGVDLVQIEPDGRNLTVIARAGAIESTPLVRALTSR